MNIKIEARDLKIIQKIAKNRGQNTSDFVRMTLRQEIARLGFLKNDAAKALDVQYQKSRKLKK